MCPAYARCWRELPSYYYLPEFTKENSSECTLSWLNESESNCVIQHTHAQCKSTQVSQAQPSKGKRLLPRWPCLQGMYLLWLANGLGVWQQVQLGAVIQLQHLIPVMGATCSFWGNIEKKKRLPSCNQKLLLSQHLACLPFMSSSFILKLILYFWYIVAQRVNGLCYLMDGTLTFSA